MNDYLICSPWSPKGDHGTGAHPEPLTRLLPESDSVDVPSVAAADPVTPRRSVRHRAGVAVRRTIGVGLVVAALWWLMLPLLFPLTSDAVVNARTVQVRAPIDGTASDLTHDVGDAVAAGQPMARLENRHLDTAGLTGLTARRAVLVTRRARLEQELSVVRETLGVCRAEADRYRAAMVTSLEATLREVTSKERSDKVEHAAAVRRLDRVKGLAGAGLSTAEFEQAQEGASVTSIRLDTDQATLTKCRAELEAARRGLFLRADVPHFQQRADELALREPTLRASLKEAADLLADVEAEIAREQARTNCLARATAEAPVGGVVWARQGNRGQGVKQNEVLYEIADGGSVFVEAAVHQRFLAAVAPGTPALVNVTGGPSLVGRVRAVRTGRPAEHAPTFAFGTSDPDPKLVRVVIDLDPGATDAAALIGRHVRVLVADPAAGPCHQAVAWLFTNLRVR